LAKYSIKCGCGYVWYRDKDHGGMVKEMIEQINEIMEGWDAGFEKQK